MGKLTRRSAMVGLAGLTVGAAAGCTHDIEPIDAAGLSDPKTPLTIDVHSHVFNGSDLQTRRFFSNVIALEREELRMFGPLIEELGEFAPSVEQEMDVLKAVAAASNRNQGAAAATVRQLREERYRDARDSLKKAYDRVYGAGAPPKPAAAAPLSPVAAAAQARQAGAIRELGFQIDALPATS